MNNEKKKKVIEIYTEGGQVFFEKCNYKKETEELMDMLQNSIHAFKQVTQLFEIGKKQEKIIQKMAEVIKSGLENDIEFTSKIDLSKVKGTQDIIEYFKKEVEKK